jgi:hypothetical protein
MHRIRGSLAAAAAVALLAAGGSLALGEMAGAATNLNATLSASGAGASAVWNPVGNPVLTVGSTSGTSAQVKITNAPSAVPASAPTFTASGFASGSPHWSIQFADGGLLYGYPSQAGTADKQWQVVPGTGACASLSHAPDTYANSLTTINNAGCGGNVTGVSIAANGGAAAGAYTISSILYSSQTLAPGADVVTVTNPGSQTGNVGVAISTLQINASSSKGDAIASYTATGLPNGLAINKTTGAITGTPTTAGNYAVTVTATDNGGTGGSASFAWLINGPTVLYSGTIRLAQLGLCLDDRGNSSTPGAVVQVWACNGLANQQWQVMSDNTIRHNGLVLDAVGRGTTNGTKVQLWTNLGGANQKWDTKAFRIHYLNPAATNKVLEDPGFGGNGTQTDIWDNNGGANQIWSTT